MEVAAELARGRERARRRSTPFSRFGGRAGSSADLHALREPQLLLEPLFVRAHLLVEPRVLDRDRRLAGEQRQDLDVALAERVELGALEIDDADAAILEQHRNRQLGAHVRQPA